MRKTAGLAALAVFGALSIAACGPTQLGAPSTTAPLTGHETADPPRLPVPRSSTIPDPAPVTNNVEIRASDGHELTVRNVVHVNGGPNNGHWVEAGQPYTVHVDHDTVFYAELSLCPGGNGVGKRQCAADDATKTLQHNASGMLATITFDGHDHVSKFQEIYAP